MTSEDEVPIPSSQHLEGATSAMPNAMIEGKRRATVFAQRKVMLSSDLGINPRARKILAEIVAGGGGETVELVDACDTLICQFRDGPDYVRASQLGKDVGNLSWLYYLVVHNQYTSPLRRLLHYPVPRDGIPGFHGLKITLSNYGGDARTYLENLITATGATFTKTMRADNTHLITARMHSEKCEAAKDWNIEITNHLWIEESYAKCQAQALSNPKYRTFPPRTNLGEVIGQTFHDERVLRDMYYPGGEDLKTTAQKKRKTTHNDQLNGTAARKTEPGFKVMNESSPGVAANARKASKAVAADFTTPAKGRHVRSGKENDTPSISTGSRSAKAQAMSKLQGLAPDIALYEKEKKRAGKDGLWGGKRAADQIDRGRSLRSSSPATEAPDEASVSSVKRPTKRAKLSLPQVELRVCLTGYKRWIGNLSREDTDKVSWLIKHLQDCLLISTPEKAPCHGRTARKRTPNLRLSRGPLHGPNAEVSPVLGQGSRGNQLCLHRRLLRKRREARPQRLYSL